MGFFSNLFTSPEKRLKQRIEQVVVEQYSSYELRPEVSPSVFNGSSDARTISYVLYYRTEPKLGIMVLSNTNDYKKADVLASHKVCKDAGFNCINIMSYLPSTYEYINGVIGNNL
ncbi:MAG: hypothetical protein IKN54_07940 [Lachnospiraceae bacterium]|nr:hypothetical protein [Lachnospiraceae bacterium]